MAAPLTPERLAELRRLVRPLPYGDQMAEAVNAVSELLAEVDRLRAALAAETERCERAIEECRPPKHPRTCGCGECTGISAAVDAVRGGHQP